MMNPLYRKMFRDPMASRKPQGILASSAPMMTAAQKAMAKNQPMKAQTGASVNTQNYMSAIAQLTQQGDVQTLTNILQDTRLPTNVRTAARSAIGSLQPKPSVAKPTPSYFDPTLTRRAYDMNLQSSSPATSSPATSPAINGSVGAYLAQLAQQTSPINNPMMSPSFVANTVMKPGDYTALRQSMQEQLSPLEISLLESGIGGLERVKGLGRALLQGPIQAEKDFQTLTTRPKKLDMGEFEGLEDLPETPSLNLLPQSSSILQDDPALAEQEVITPDITDTGVSADMEDAATTTTTTTDAATTTTTTTDAVTAAKEPVIKMLAEVQAGRETDANLNAEQASTPEAAAALNESFMKDMVMPEEVTLSDMEKKAKDIMGFDPSKADEQKRHSFWTNLTMAGLAMAAGESDNALTNVAKGLMVGLDAYSKDIKDLNAQDREDRKEYRATLRTLIKNEEDKNIAFAEMQNNYNAKSAELDQRAALEGENQDIQRERLALDKSLAQQRMETQLVTTLAQLDMDAERLALQGKQLDETVRHNKVQESLLNLAEQPEWVKSAIPLGWVDSQGNWTEDGLTWVNDNANAIMLTSFLDTKNKSTDDDRDAQAISNILSGNYDADDIARASNSAVGKIILGQSGEKDFVAVLQQLVPQAPKV